MPVILQVVVLFASLAGWTVGGLALFGDRWNSSDLAKWGWAALVAVSFCGLYYAATALGMFPT